MRKGFLFRYFVLLMGMIFSFSVAAEEDEQLRVKMYESPRRDISVIITPEGYYPDKISVFTGEKVRFFVTSTVDTPSCFLIKEHEVYLSAFRGNLTEGEVEFKHSGNFDIYCPSMKHKGHLTVIKKYDPSRGIASKSKAVIKKEWTPRD